MIFYYGQASKTDHSQKTILKLIFYVTVLSCVLSPCQVYSFCPETCVWKGQGSFECAGFNAGAVGMRDRIYILGGDYSPDEITDEVQVRKRCQSAETACSHKVFFYVLTHNKFTGAGVSQWEESVGGSGANAQSAHRVSLPAHQLQPIPRSME